MRSVIKKTAAALGLAGALALGAWPAAQAASIPSQTLAVKAAAPDHITDVYWRRGGWGWGPGIGFGVAAGALTAAAIAGGPYWGGYPYYGGYYPAYSYYPAYTAPYPYWRHRRVIVHRRPYWRRHHAYWGGPRYRHAYWGGGPYYGW